MEQILANYEVEDVIAVSDFLTSHSEVAKVIREAPAQLQQILNYKPTLFLRMAYYEGLMFMVGYEDMTAGIEIYNKVLDEWMIHIPLDIAQYITLDIKQIEGERK